MLPLQQFTDYIAQRQLFNKTEHVLLAVSGGKDSVMMAYLFKQAGFHFGIAHCNFNLRKGEAQRDEAFVQQLAAKMQVPFHVVHFDTNAFAKKQGVSTQMAARQLRYHWFEEVRKQHRYHYIAVAHHQNDAIETVLLNLVRGTGISGMHGILPKRGHLIRPLLFLSRQQIDELVEANKLAYVEDSSNQSSKYARNKLRLKVIPHLRELNPKLEETFAQNITRFTQVEALLQREVEKHRKKIQVEGNHLYLDIEAVQALSPQQLLLFELLSPYGFSASVVDEIINSLSKQTGTSFYSVTHRLTLDRGRLIISPLEEKQSLLVYLYGEGAQELTPNTKIALRFSEKIAFGKESHRAYIDADLLVFPLMVRYREEGDKFKPLGMRQFKKLSDFLVDNKVPLPQKDKIPLLINGNGELIWVVGLRQDERYKVGATTKKVAIFEWLNL